MRSLLAILCALSVFRSAGAVAPAWVLDADTGITLRPGFDAELLYVVPKAQGSWIAMAFDPTGRLLVSDQDETGMYRVTLPTAGAGLKVENLPGFPYEPIEWGSRKVGGAFGLVHAFDSLYLANMRGFYRIRDTDGDDQYDEFTLLKKLNVGYEHSAHSIIPTADGTGLYLVAGNYTHVPEGLVSVQPRVWQEDSLLPIIPDPSGHSVGLEPPGGWICRISPDGKEWRLIASGFRNSVDLALNREGELFTYDSDMEFDIGSPWYRPTRINHVTSGAEFGWRANTGVWRDYFADSLGSVLDMGPGSPTAISFGHHSNFPAEFQDNLFVCDWTFGTIFTVTMQETGSSYTGTKAEFLHGSPLNIAAMRFGPDGAMYFLTGGRLTESRLYRVRYTGGKTSGAARTLLANSELRALRHSLEQLPRSRRKRGSSGEGMAVSRACRPAHPLRRAHRDRESRRLPVAGEGLCGEKSARRDLRGHRAEPARRQVPLRPAARQARRSSFCRRWNAKTNSRCSAPTRFVSCAWVSRLRGQSGSHHRPSWTRISPSNDDAVNAELCRVLAFLDAPSVARKTIALMKSEHADTVDYDKAMLGRHEYGAAILKMMANTPNTRNIHFADCLRRVRRGWALEDRKYFFGWLNEALAKDGGKSFAGYIRAIRKDAIAQLETADVEALTGLLDDFPTVDLSKLPQPKGPPRRVDGRDRDEAVRSATCAAAISRTARRCSPPDCASPAIASAAKAATPAPTSAPWATASPSATSSPPSASRAHPSPSNTWPAS